jgi:putative SOS response-associated peptidase YedK
LVEAGPQFSGLLIGNGRKRPRSDLYSETKGQAPIRALFRTFPGIFPDQLAPIVRNNADGERELVMARWGMPGPLQFGGQPVTNIRNVSSPHWRGWLSARTRCLVPATSFCEYADTKPRKTPTWFALSEDGRCSPSRASGGGGGACEGRRAHRSRATTTEEFDLWLEGETVEALKLQRPLPDGMLDIVARGEKEDPPLE